MPRRQSELRVNYLSKAMNDTSYKLLWRGALGGLLGAPLFLIGLALNDKFRLGHVRYGGLLQIMALPYFLPIGAALGAITGGIIWLFTTKAKVNAPAIVRAAIGAGFILLLFGVVRLIKGEEASGLIPPTTVEALVNGLLFITFFGVLPGLMARPKKIEAQV